MTYNLAKQLKDAGFPQREPNGFPGILNPDGDKDVYYPTLSELIEACLGTNWNGSFSISHDRNYTIKWFANIFTNERVLTGTGATPEEAVAKLWLALNGK